MNSKFDKIKAELKTCFEKSRANKVAVILLFLCFIWGLLNIPAFFLVSQSPTADYALPALPWAILMLWFLGFCALRKRVGKEGYSEIWVALIFSCVSLLMGTGAFLVMQTAVATKLAHNWPSAAYVAQSCVYNLNNMGRLLLIRDNSWMLITFCLVVIATLAFLCLCYFLREKLRRKRALHPEPKQKRKWKRPNSNTVWGTICAICFFALAYATLICAANFQTSQTTLGELIFANPFYFMVLMLWLSQVPFFLASKTCTKKAQKLLITGALLAITLLLALFLLQLFDLQWPLSGIRQRSTWQSYFGFNWVDFLLDGPSGFWKEWATSAFALIFYIPMFLLINKRFFKLSSTVAAFACVALALMFIVLMNFLFQNSFLPVMLNATIS